MKSLVKRRNVKNNYEVIMSKKKNSKKAKEKNVKAAKNKSRTISKKRGLRSDLASDPTSKKKVKFKKKVVKKKK